MLNTHYGPVGKKNWRNITEMLIIYTRVLWEEPCLNENYNVHLKFHIKQGLKLADTEQTQICPKNFIVDLRYQISSKSIQYFRKSNIQMDRQTFDYALILYILWKEYHHHHKSQMFRSGLASFEPTLIYFEQVLRWLGTLITPQISVFCRSHVNKLK